jgi:CRP-like cAMP-binding protein
VSSNNTLNFLMNNPVLRKCAAPELNKSARLWRLQRVDAGDILWVQGMPSQELAVVVQGEFSVDVNGVEVGLIRSGELIGEVATFFGQERSASLRAKTRVQILTLSIDGLRTLRREGSPVYLALLDQALVSVVRRVRSTNVRIAKAATGGQAAPSRKDQGAFAKMWKKFRPGLPKVECPPIEPLLKKQPGLNRIDDASLAKLGGMWTATAVEEGHVVCLEGEEGATAYLIAMGDVDVLRNVRGDKAEKLCTLGAGDQFGANTLVEKGTRTASCVMATAGWLYSIDSTSFRNPPAEVGHIWKESVLATLTSQIRNANRALNLARARSVATEKRAEMKERVATAGVRKKAASKKKRDNFAQLLQASGYLEGLPTSEEGLEQVDFVIDEDMARTIAARKVR